MSRSKIHVDTIYSVTYITLTIPKNIFIHLFLFKIDISKYVVYYILTSGARKRLEKKQNNSLKKEKNMTTTLIPGHYGSTERVLSRLPDLFNDNWLSNSIDDWAKALDVPNAVYPYNIKLVKDKNDQDKQYEIEVALAGVGKENIEIKVRDGLLNIEVAKSEPDSTVDESYLRKGISHRSGKLSFSLGEKVQKKKISSSYTDGLLKVVLPLAQPETLNIDVKVL